ncbi:MAG TPA: hypothetical protein VIL27_09450, partial [Clostridia bacterium]
SQKIRDRSLTDPFVRELTKVSLQCFLDRVKQDESGQTIAVWCAAHDIKPCNFNYWQRRLRIRSEDTTSQPVKWLTLDCEILETTEQDLTPDTIGVQIGQARISLSATNISFDFLQ